MSYDLPKPRDYSRSGKTLYQAAGGKRASIVMIGASVDWGYGLDLTEQYSYKMQMAIDAYLYSQGWRPNAGSGTNLGGWVPRFIHTDDWQTGGPAAGATPTYYPYNGSPQASGWAAGLDNPSSYTTDSYGTPVPFAPSAAGYTTVRRAKLNWNDYPGAGGTVPGAADCGIFGKNTYSGDKNGTCTNGGVYLDATYPGSLRWAVNFTKGQTAYVQFRITELTGISVVLQLLGTNDNGATLWTIPNYNNIPFPNTGLMGISGGNSADVLMQFTVNSTTINPIQLMALTYNSGSGRALIEVIAPLNGVQATNHLLVQVCARNSYCLQDYASVNTYPTLAGGTPVSNPGTGTGQRYTVEGAGNAGTKRTCVQQIINGVANKYDGSANAHPFFILGDTYNSMVTQWTNGVVYDKRLTPSDYAQQLKLLGKDLLATEGGGQIILTMPIRTQTALTLAGSAASFTPGWSGYGMRNTSSGSTYCWEDYWQAIYNLAAAMGWGFVDQGQLDCIVHTPTAAGSGGGNPYAGASDYWSECPSLGATWTAPGTKHFQNDGLHPSPDFASQNATLANTIAGTFISALGLDGGH